MLANSNEKIVQRGLTHVGVSAHQMIFCTRKTKKEKKGISFRSFKQSSVNQYEMGVGKVIFRNYKKHYNVIKAYNKFLKIN